MACGASSRHNGMAEAWTGRSLLQWARDWLAKKGMENPRLDAELLLAHALRCDRVRLYIDADKPLAAEELARFKSLIKRRGALEPGAAAGVARATGEKPAPGRVGGVRGVLSPPLRKKALYDAIAANPPYVPTAEVGRLGPDVIKHEPHIALFAGEDGLAVIRRIVAGVGEWLAPGGLFVTEIDPSQGEAVAHLLRDAGLMQVRVERDLAGLDRHVAGRRA